MSAFNDIKQKATAFYQSKTDSEQKMLLLLSISIVLFILFSSYSTVSNGVVASQLKLDKQVKLNTWADEQIAIIQANQGRSSSAQTRSGSMTQQINTTARRYNVTLARVQPQSDNAVKIGLDPMSFNTLINWLAELENRYGIQVSNIDISETGVSGEVKVRRLDLER